MPTNMQRLTGVLVSSGITVGGAWVASTAHSNTEDKTLTSFADGLNITVENVRNDSVKTSRMRDSDFIRLILIIMLEMNTKISGF